MNIDQCRSLVYITIYLFNTGFVRSLENLEKPGILTDGLEKPGKLEFLQPCNFSMGKPAWGLWDGPYSTISCCLQRHNEHLDDVMTFSTGQLCYNYCAKVDMMLWAFWFFWWLHSVMDNNSNYTVLSAIKISENLRLSTGWPPDELKLSTKIFWLSNNMIKVNSTIFLLAFLGCR